MRSLGAHRGGTLAAAVIVALIALLVYARGFDAPFVLDDGLSVSENYSIRRLSDLATVFSPPGHLTVGGRPVANLTFAVDYALHGLNPRGYRVTNFVIHLATAWLLFGLLRRTLLRTRWRSEARAIAAGISVIWLLHPVQTGTVGYISQRTELLMALFYVMTLHGFLRAIEVEGAQSRVRRSLWLGASAAACALGMGSKEVMVTAPLLVLAYDRVFVARTFRAALQLRWCYYGALAATWLWLAYCMWGGLKQRAVGFDLGVTSWTYALTETEALVRYLGLAVWPQPLVFDYGPQFMSGVSAALPYLLVLGPIFVVLAHSVIRFPRAGFLAASFFGLLAPTSSVIPVATQPIAESRMYLPLACAVALVVLGTRTVVGRIGFRVFCVATALAGAVAGFSRMAVLRDPLAMWTDTLAKRPDNSRAHSNYGAALFGVGRTDEAIAHERRALALDPEIPRAHANLAGALLKQGRPEEALRHGYEALRLYPGLTEAHYQVGNALAALGRYAEAAEHYRAETLLRPDDAESYLNLGSALYMAGRPHEAIPHYEMTLRLKPDDELARTNLAGALAQTGRPAEAVELYRQALAARPADVGTRCNLALTLARLGRVDEAEQAYRAALQLQPDFAPAREGLLRLQGAGATQPGSAK